MWESGTKQPALIERDLLPQLLEALVEHAVCVTYDTKTGRFKIGNLRREVARVPTAPTLTSLSTTLMTDVRRLNS